MKHSKKLLLLLASYSLSANAATININDFLPNTDGTTTADGYMISSVTSGNTITYSFTQTADLDGGGSADTLSFDLVYEAYTGSTFTSPDVILGAASLGSSNNINWHSNGFADGDTLSLAVANVVYTDGEGDDTLAFDGFTELNLLAYGADPATGSDFYIGTTGANVLSISPIGPADLTSNGTNSSLLFTAGADTDYRLRNLDFQFETSPIVDPPVDPPVDPAIPEPSRALLLGLGALAMFARRRR